MCTKNLPGRLFCYAFIVAALARVISVQAGPYVDTLPNGMINAGAAFKYTVYSIGGDMQIDNTITGPSAVYGNVGVGGNGNFTMSDGDVYGNVYYHSGGSVTLSGPAKIHGSKFIDDANLDQAALDGQSLSDAAFAEAVTPAYASLTNVNITNSSQNMTITGGPNQKVVLKLTNFVMTQGTFTLQGTATTSFIINVSKTFSLSGASKIALMGVPAANVLWNIRGTGSMVTINGGSVVYGTILATKRLVGIDPGIVYGRVIANAVKITSGGQVVSQ